MERYDDDWWRVMGQVNAKDNYPYDCVSIRCGGQHARMCVEIDTLRAIKKSNEDAYAHLVEINARLIGELASASLRRITPANRGWL